MAAVCCASTSRRGDGLAQRRHRHDPLARRPRGRCRRRANGRRRLDGRGAEVTVPARAARACSSSARVTSCFEMRPPRPLPLTSSTASPLSASARRARGRRPHRGLGRRAGRCRRPGARSPWPGAAGLLGPLLDLARSPRRRRPSRPPGARSCGARPAPGDGTSTVALSVSTSTSGSSTETWSPSACFQAPERRLADRLTERGNPQLHRHQLAPFPERFRHEPRLLTRVALGRAGRRAGRRGRVTRRPGERPCQKRRQLAVHVGPGAHVPRLFLHPDDRRAVGVRPSSASSSSSS